MLKAVDQAEWKRTLEAFTAKRSGGLIQKWAEVSKEKTTVNRCLETIWKPLRAPDFASSERNSANSFSIKDQPAGNLNHAVKEFLRVLSSARIPWKR